MRITKWALSIAFLVQSTLSFVPLISISKVAAQAEPPAPSVQVESQGDQTADVTYEYVAQPGDSFAKIARKAVQTYGAKYQVTLTPAKIIFAETHLTLDAASPMLDVGQQVSLKESSIKVWVDQAIQLTPAKEAAWNEYAEYADFNTDKVGQAS